MVRQKYSDNISRLSWSMSVLYINCVEMVKLKSELDSQRCMSIVHAHLCDLLFRQFRSGDPFFCIHRDRDELSKRWGRLEPEFRVVVELSQPQLVE